MTITPLEIARDFAEIPFEDHHARILALDYLRLVEMTPLLRDCRRYMQHELDNLSSLQTNFPAFELVERIDELIGDDNG